MKLFTILILAWSFLFGGSSMSLYDFKVKDIDGHEFTLERYKGRVMLIVNVASQCGYTAQYAGLEELDKKYKAEGLSILGFPCNQFLSQEPGTEEEIKNFCSSNFGVTFDMFSKIDVNGKNTHPLYKYLKQKAGGALGIDAIKWNFTKFLVDRNGKVLRRYAPSTTLQEIDKDIKALL
jgi:glutathione peroxidase